MPDTFDTLSASPAPLSVPDPTPIANSINKAIGEALSTIPDGRNGALLMVTTPDGSQGVFAARVGDHWKLAAGGGVDRNLHVSGFVGAEVVW